MVGLADLGGPGDLADLCAKVVTNAAPVGVTVSPSIPAGWMGTPGNMAATAGAGRGMVPWAQSTVPEPMGKLEHTISFTASWSRARQAPTTSTMASTAPTSWKWTSPADTPWTSPSASAS